MIRINLARQLQAEKPSGRKTTEAGLYVLIGLLVFCLGGGSWWWTDSLQARVGELQEDKQVIAADLNNIGQQLEGREGEMDRYNRYLQVAQEMYGVKNTGWPLMLMDEMSRGLDELRIWLKRVEVQGDTVEILGQSLKMNDVGKFLDVLEESQIIEGVPFVEIRDVQEGKRGLYAFRIRFAVNPRALT